MSALSSQCSQRTTMTSSSFQTQNPSFTNTFDSPKFSSSVAKLSTVQFTNRNRRGVRCELRSAENGQSGVIIERAWESESGLNHSRRRSWTSSVSISRNLEMDSTSKSMKKVCLFYCEEMKSLAERVAAQSDFIELRSIDWKTFEDGFPNLFIPTARGIRGQHVAFLASFSSPGVIFGQMSVIYALLKLFISSFSLVLPFFPTGTSERMEDEGDVATAYTLARILSSISISRGGPASLVTYDIHALQERFYFGDNILPCFESGIPLLTNRLQQLPDSDNISIAFPDDGASKRFHKQLQHFPMIVCAKVREGDKRIVCLKEGDPNGRHVVIVDDLVQSGSTLIECQKVLANHGAAKISAYVTHGIFPNNSWKRFKPDNGGDPANGFTNFWITDSCPLTVTAVMKQSPFEILSLAPSIASALQI